MRVAISSGHGKHVPGAVGGLNERAENVRVANRLGQILNCPVFHDDVSRNVRDNVNSTARWHNQQTRDLDVQIHFNAFSPTPGPRGTEMLYRANANRALAARCSLAVAQAGGFIDRGAKQRFDLGFLNQVARPAVLTEICFVDSQRDVTLYQASFEPIVQALAGALVNSASTAPPLVNGTPRTLRKGDTGPEVAQLQQLLGDLAVDGAFGEKTDARVREFQEVNPLLVVDGIVGPLTWWALLS